MKKFKYFKSYRQQNFALLGTVFLVLILAYKANISTSIQRYQQYKNAKTKLESAQTASREIAQYTSLLRGMQRTGQQPYNREYLLEQITGFCREHNLLIKTFPNALKVTENNYPVITNELEIEGSFKDLTALAYRIEQEQKLGSLSALKFFLVKDRVRQKNNLHAYFVLRNSEPL